MNETEIKLMIEQIGYTEFYRYYQEKDKEIERLNNIINELEKKLLELRLTDVDGKTIVYRLLDKLQKLKHKKIYGSSEVEFLYFDEVGSDE